MASQGSVKRASGRLAELVGLGALASLVPRGPVDSAIAAHEWQGQRVRKLPPHLVVYLLMALCLFLEDDYEEVAEKLTGVLARVPGSTWRAPTRGAVTQARGRLGADVLRELFTQIARPAAAPGTLGARLGRWRVAIDGFVLDLPDTDSNVEEFGKTNAGDPTVFPQARVVALSECASHAIVAADVAGCWAGEQTMAFSLYEHVTEEMLLTADRWFL